MDDNELKQLNNISKTVGDVTFVRAYLEKGFLLFTIDGEVDNCQYRIPNNGTNYSLQIWDNREGQPWQASLERQVAERLKAIADAEAARTRYEAAEKALFGKLAWIDEKFDEGYFFSLTEAYAEYVGAGGHIDGPTAALSAGQRTHGRMVAANQEAGE